MKKIANYLILTFVLGIGTMFCFNMGAKALEVQQYNGTGGGTGSGGTTTNCDFVSKNFCQWDFTATNQNYRYGIRVSFVYYDGTKYEQLGKHIDIWQRPLHWSVSQNMHYAKADRGTKTIGGTVGPDDFEAGNASYVVMSELPSLINASDGSASKQLESIFLKQDVMNEYAIELTGVGLNDDVCKEDDASYNSDACEKYKAMWGRPNQKADKTKAAEYGYRFLIEPIQGYQYKDGSLYVMTLTELARATMGGFEKSLPGKYSENELLWTSFKDIGIIKVTPCKLYGRGIGCKDPRDLADPQQGHALQIIDFSDFIKTTLVCDYEALEKKEKGDELTEEEKKCCDEKKNEIINKYKNTSTTSLSCMMTTNSVPSFINCMERYFQGNVFSWEKEKQELLEFEKKYPVCNNDECAYEELVEIEEEFEACIMDFDIIEWMENLILCIETSCDYSYKVKLNLYKEDHWSCDVSEFEDKFTTNKCKKIPNIPTSGCDEDNPIYFPKSNSSSNSDMSCCLYFEVTMKEEYEKQGLSKGEIREKIENWFNEPGKEFRKNCLNKKSCNIEDPAPFTETCCKELMNAYPNYPKSFWEERGCTPDEKKECTWSDYADELIEKLKVMVGANCAVDKNTAEAHDIGFDNECLFDSVNITPGTREEVFIDYYVKYSNPYCSVYCREDVKYDFPDGSMIVKAGNHFTVGETEKGLEWKNVKFSSKRECKTYGSTRDEESKKINTEKFEVDWEKANDLVISTWDSWKIAQDRVWSVNTAHRTGECGCCCPPGGGTCNCKTPCGSRMLGGLTSYTTFKGNTVTIQESWCTAYTSTSAKRSMVASAQARTHAAHENAKQNMHTIETDIHACTSWNEFDSYQYTTFSSTNVKADRYAKYPTYNEFVTYKEFSPNLKINYNEFSYSGYNYNELLKKDEGATVVSNKNFSIRGKLFDIKYNCPPGSAPNLKHCEKELTFEYSPQSEAHATYSKEIKYTLQDGVFNTILKPQGIAVSGTSGLSSNQIYINLGYSALHVHFMTPTGRYDIGLSYQGFSPGSAVTNFKHNFDKIIGDNYTYECTYQVYNQIIENDDPNCVGDNCEPCKGDNCLPCKGDNCTPAGLKGLNLIYRPISLGNPFPGIDGDGRTPGSNWNDARVIKNFITNNRGVSGSSIYTKAPMYQITLTPALIQKIRKYNESTTYSDFNMECTAEAKECKSYFIRGNPEDSTYDFSSHFQTCKLEGNRGSRTCCGIGNWNDCDNQDGITRR